MAQSLFQKADPRQEALRDLLDEVLRCDGASTRIAALITGLDVAYDLGDGHPLLGRRMPDLDIVTPDGPVRVYELLHQARPLLLQLGGPELDAGARTVRHVSRPTRVSGSCRCWARSPRRRPSWCAPTATWHGPARTPLWGSAMR